MGCRFGKLVIALKSSQVPAIGPQGWMPQTMYGLFAKYWQRSQLGILGISRTIEIEKSLADLL